MNTMVKKEYRATRSTYKSEVLYVEAHTDEEAEKLALSALECEWENTTDERTNGEIEVEET